MSPVFLSVQRISKSFQMRADKISALTDVSFEVTEGEFTALVGPSGSGKTTLLNLIGCLDKPDQGQITLEGRELTTLSHDQLSKERLRSIGFIFQDYNLIPTLTVLENVEYVLWLQRVGAAERRERAKAVLERVGLGKFGVRKPNALSRGQQQRVAISRAIAHRPKIVLGDELTANLDHKTGKELMEFLRELNREQKITFLFSTHDPVMMEYAERRISLLDGKLIGDHRS